MRKTRKTSEKRKRVKVRKTSMTKPKVKKVRKRKMVRARKKKKATINRINRLILKIILPTTNYNTNKKHITTSIYDKNENFCFSRKIFRHHQQEKNENERLKKECYKKNREKKQKK